MGIANANVARRWSIDDINAGGGLLGRRSSSIIEDGATIDSVAAAKAAKLVAARPRRRDLRRHLQLDAAGDQRSRGRRGQTLYIYPEQYEGHEFDPLIFCTGPVPAQQVEPLHSLADARNGREEILPAVGRLYLAAHDEPEGARDRHGQRRRDRRRGVFPARSYRLSQDRREDRVQRRGGRLQHHRPAGPHAVP